MLVYIPAIFTEFSNLMFFTSFSMFIICSNLNKLIKNYVACTSAGLGCGVWMFVLSKERDCNWTGEGLKCSVKGLWIRLIWTPLHLWGKDVF